jgi:hypothetical protein
MRYRWLKPVESFIGKIASRAAARRLAYYPIWPPKSGRNSPAPEGCAAGGHSRAAPSRLAAAITAPGFCTQPPGFIRRPAIRVFDEIMAVTCGFSAGGSVCRAPVGCGGPASVRWRARAAAHYGD